MDRRSKMIGFGAKAPVVALFVGLVVALGGCDKMPWSHKDEGASGTAGATADACKQYVAKVCDKAGQQSATCTNITAAGNLLPPDSCKAALANVDYSIKKLGEKRAKCDELVTKLCKAIGENTETCGMIKQQTPKFPPERCEMMLAHYDQVLASVKQQEAMNKPLSSDEMTKIASGDAPSFGPKDAKVTIVEFSDFQCPFCGRAAPVVDQIRKNYGDKVRFVFRQFPLPMHPNAKPAAEAALEAQAQGKFWEFHDKLFEHQQQLDRDSILKYAKEVGLNVKAVDTALDQNKYADTIQSDMKLGEEVAVNGTPTMFVNGERVSNPTSYDVVKQMIDKKLSGG